ncbi:MAG: hypothetical protein WKF96_07690 [Solirubrobacteraceae bacterium]
MDEFVDQNPHPGISWAAMHDFMRQACVEDDLTLKLAEVPAHLRA